MNKKLYFTIGPSGTGKSSYIKKNFKSEVVVSPDDLRRQLTGDVSNHSQENKIWTAVPKLLQQRLDKYDEAVLDATNVDSGNRANILKNFKRDEVERIAIIFEIEPEESKRRVKADIEAGKDRSNVPEDVIDKQYIKFKRGYNTIKQQFDKIIYADKGEQVMQKEDINKIKKIIFEEMKKLKEEDAKEAQERAQYQAYQDMYLTPQSHWKLKKYANMYDVNGNLYRGKLGEVHRIQTVEYDFMHTGEVVTECGEQTYSLDAEDFRECFEMVNDEEGLKLNNESIIKEDIKKLVKVKNYFGKNIKESIERLEKILLKEFEYEDSGGLMQDPEEEDPYHQNKKWTKVIPEFYYNDDFEEIDLLTLIYNDNNTNVSISGKRDEPGSRTLTFELATGKSISIKIPTSDIERARHDLLNKDFIEYDTEEGQDYYYLTEKGLEFCRKHNLQNSLRGVLDNIKEIDNSL